MVPPLKGVLATAYYRDNQLLPNVPIRALGLLYVAVVLDSLYLCSILLP
jgi:hypothetical protein